MLIFINKKNMEILTEKEFRTKMTIIYQQERIKILNEKWDRLSKDDKLIIIEMFKLLNPDVKIPINEAKWYNTVMDWAGLIPGIGSAVDLVNGFSYWRQGDKLFAILSWIGALPIFGDLIAAPVVSALKVGGRGAELFKGAVLAKDAVKVAETAKNLGGPVAKMVEKAPSWGGKLIEVLEKSVGKFPWLGKGLVDTVKSWVGIFSKAGKNMNAISSLGRPAVRKLTNNTKFYLGLLDSLGLGNFSGPPEELAKKVPNLAQKVADFEATPEGKNLSMGGTMAPTEPSTTPSQTTFTPPKAPSTSKTDDPISMLSSMLM
jgi:hypothetical protein